MVVKLDVSNEQAIAFQERAKVAVNNNDGAALAATVQEMMLRSHSYVAFNQTAGKMIPIYSAINSTPSLVEKGEATPISHISETTHEEFQTIMRNSRAAQDVWQHVPIEQRRALIKLIQQKLETRLEAFKFVISADTGKTLKNGDGELVKTKEWFDWIQQPHLTETLKPQVNYRKGAQILEHSRHAPDVVPPGADNVQITRSRPIGVVGVITSFNYPMALSIGGVLQGLLTGNSVIFKASQKAPHWAFLFKDVFLEAFQEWSEKNLSDAARKAANGKDGWIDDAEKYSGTKLTMAKAESLAENLFHITAGREAKVVQEVDLLDFVGSRSTGLKFEAERNRAGKRTALELGGNSAVLVMPSAVENDADMDVVAAKIFKGNTDNSGQRCTKAALLMVHETIDDKFIEKLTALYKNAKGIGNPFDQSNSVGALVDEEAFNRMEAIVKQAEEHGAKVTWNGRMGDNQSPKGGIYTNPAIIDWTGVSDTNKKEIKALMEEETFAPLLHVVKKVKSVEEAATITNELDKEKLSASIFTKVDAEFDKFSDKVSCHSITRNDAPKDQSPGGKHGNYGHHAKGGDNSLEGFVVEKTGTYTRDHASAVLNYESNIYGSRGNELGFAA